MDSKMKFLDGQITRDDVLAEQARTGEPDFWRAKDAIVKRLTEESNELERQRDADLASQGPAWRIEPSTALELQNEMRDFGLSAARMPRRKIAPGIGRGCTATQFLQPCPRSPEIAAAIATADEAQNRARQLIESEQALVDDLKAGIVQLAGIRQQIRRIRQLALDKVGARELRRAALRWWLAAKAAATTQNVSGLENTVKDLLWRTALGPEINEFATELEGQASALIGQIRTRAKNSKINLREFVEFWKQENAKRPGANLEADFDIYAGLVQNAELSHAGDEPKT